MGPLSTEGKKQVDLTLNQGQAKKLQTNLDEIEAHVMKLAADWPALLPDQREKLLAASPVLARVVKLAHLFEERI